MTSKIKVDNINKVSDDSNIIKKCGTTITLGASGDSIALASGASQTGFGRTGTVDWVTTPKTSTFTAVSGEGYFCNTASGGFTCNLPAGSAGSIVSVADYAATWQTGNLIVSPNGSEKIGGGAANVTLDTKGQSVTFVYVDSTQGWVNTMDSTSNVRGNEYIIATGGTITESGNDRIHKFTGPGTFTVSDTAVCAANNLVSYMVVAGAGGGGYDVGGGGGAGGFRGVKSPSTPYTASPLDGYGTPGNRITVTATGYPITVGGGGVGALGAPTTRNGGSGVNSTFSTITSAGGGGGGGWPSNNGLNGGSGGGGSGHTASSTGGSGNTPPVSPAQGFGGGSNGVPNGDATGGGGGGATAVGAAAIVSPNGQVPGGAGAATSISASPVTYSAGGKGSEDGAPTITAGAANTGNAGDGAGNSPSLGNVGAAGGSGIVIIRYRYQT